MALIPLRFSLLGLPVRPPPLLHCAKYVLRCPIPWVVLFTWLRTRKIKMACAVCASTVLAEASCAGRADANTVCAACGMKVVEPPFEDCDYFDLIMRLGRPKSHDKSRRRIVSEDW